MVRRRGHSMYEPCCSCQLFVFWQHTFLSCDQHMGPFRKSHCCCCCCCLLSLLPQEPFPGAVMLTTTAAVAANMFESYLGAVVQGRCGWCTNDVVNAMQTCAAAAAAMCGRYAILGAAQAAKF
jgi:hypothetical protein